VIGNQIEMANDWWWGKCRKRENLSQLGRFDRIILAHPGSGLDSGVAK
jgi:hypothetical protein